MDPPRVGSIVMVLELDPQAQLVTAASNNIKAEPIRAEGRSFIRIIAYPSSCRSIWVTQSRGCAKFSTHPKRKVGTGFEAELCGLGAESDGFDGETESRLCTEPKPPQRPG